MLITIRCVCVKSYILDRMGHPTRKNKASKSKLSPTLRVHKHTTKKTNTLTFPPDIYNGLVIPDKS